MGCQNCAGLTFPECGGPALLICVRREGDAFPRHVWAVAVCEGSAVDSYELYADSELTEVTDYTMADRVTCPQDYQNITAPLLNQLEVHQLAVEEALEEVEQSIEQAGQEIEDAISAASIAQINALNSAAGNIIDAIQLAADGVDSLGNPLPQNFDSLPVAFG